MNKNLGLYVTYILTIIWILFSFVYPIIVNAWFKKEIENQKTGLTLSPVQIKEEKTLDSEIDRLSVKYGVASSSARSIIKCESQMYGSAVNYNRLPDGTIWSEDRGPFQINNYFHKDAMSKLGLDYYDQWDSLEYGFILFSEQGSKPWEASRNCWSKLIG